VPAVDDNELPLHAKTTTAITTTTATTTTTITRDTGKYSLKTS